MQIVAQPHKAPKAFYATLYNGEQHGVLGQVDGSLYFFGDDGSIVDYLRSQRVKATFFAGGHWMVSHKARTQQLLSDPLFEVGTHGWAHRNTRLLAGLELQREIIGPSATYAAIRRELSDAQCVAPVRTAVGSLGTILGALVAGLIWLLAIGVPIGGFIWACRKLERRLPPKESEA